MQKSRKEAKLISVWLLIFLTCVASAAGQSRMNGVSVSLSVSDTKFNKETKPVATIAIHNNTGRMIAMSEFASFTLELQPNASIDFCRLSECLSTTVFPPNKRIKSGGTITISVKLSEMHWEDPISSISDGSRSKNLFVALDKGAYRIFARLSFKVDNWIKADPRYKEIRSNTIAPVNLMGES